MSMKADAETEQANHGPLVSIVITTRNEEHNIGNCLRSVSLQDYTNIEVLVVDNNSTDQTKLIAQEFNVQVFNLGPERSAQRNYGLIEIATGKYGMFIDADMVLTPTLVSKCVDEMELNRTFGLHIEEIILGRKWLSKVRRYERQFYSGTVIDGIRFFNREKFVEIGGFDSKLPPGPEDWDLDKRMKLLGNLKLLSNCGTSLEWTMSDFIRQKGIEHESTYIGIYHNEDEVNLKKYIKKKIYYSESMAYYRSKWKSSDPDVRKQLGILYRYVFVFTEMGKWRKIVTNPVLFMQVFLLRCLVGLAYVYTKNGTKNH